MHATRARPEPRARRRRRLCAALALALAAALPSAMAQPAAQAQHAGVQGAEPGQASSGDEALDNAVAAVVVAALSDQLGVPAIEVRLDSFDVASAGPRDRSVSGQGRLRMGGDGGWIGFRYRTLYDSLLRSAGYPELTIGGVGAGEHEVPNDARLVSELEDRVASGLASQGRGTPRLQLDRITTVEGGQRLLRIAADGVADFGLDGTSAIEIVGLYDRIADRWQRVDYTLGSRPR